MKKIVLFLATVLLASCAVAQTTAPRYGTDKHMDNTGRVLTYAVITTTDVTSATLDTITITPNAWSTIVCMQTGSVSINLADSVCYKWSSKTNTYKLGDECLFMFSKGSLAAGKIKFGGSVYILSTTSNAVLLAAGKSMVMRFRWNGSAWIEATRMVQP